jgi:hypothetical protein
LDEIKQRVFEAIYKQDDPSSIEEAISVIIETLSPMGSNFFSTTMMSLLIVLVIKDKPGIGYCPLLCCDKIAPFLHNNGQYPVASRRKRLFATHGG